MPLHISGSEATELIGAVACIGVPLMLQVVARTFGSIPRLPEVIRVVARLQAQVCSQCQPPTRQTCGSFQGLSHPSVTAVGIETRHISYA